jgi:hypothetical protein
MDEAFMHLATAITPLVLIVLAHQLHKPAFVDLGCALMSIMALYYLLAFEKDSKKIDAVFILAMFIAVVITIHYVAHL